MKCPRRDESPFGTQFPRDDDLDQSDDSCHYCGSLNPDTFMARCEAGDVELGPTDKPYKVYVRNVGGKQFKQTYRNCPPQSTCTGPSDCTHWKTDDRSETKFYFQHLSVEQKKRFVELINERKLKFGYPGHFYVAPYFVSFGHD